MLWLVVTWDEGQAHVREFSDGGEARLVYDEYLRIYPVAYLYVTDDSGRMDLILEAERLPPPMV